MIYLNRIESLLAILQGFEVIALGNQNVELHDNLGHELPLFLEPLFLFRQLEQVPELLSVLQIV